jgi:DNA-3-methyladenine glycosylase II
VRSGATVSQRRDLSRSMSVRDPLTVETLAKGVAELRERDPHLAAVVDRYGPPPLWDRAPGFQTLVQIILEQQISLSAGRAAYERLERLAGGEVTPERVAALSLDELRSAGQTRQKSVYIRELATAIVEGRFDTAALAEMDDEAARAALVSLKGIGPWTANIYLLMALGRPDVWPGGDLALVAAMREVKRMRTLPDARRIDRLTRSWSPWRAVAARVLWHHYLSTPRRRQVSAAKRSALRTAAQSGRRDRTGRPAVVRSRTPSRASVGAGSSTRAARTPRGGRTRG